MVAGLNKGKTGPSPRCIPEMVGFASTPIAQDLSTIALEVNPLVFEGATIFAFLPTTERSFFVENLVAEDKFTLVAGEKLGHTPGEVCPRLLCGNLTILFRSLSIFLDRGTCLTCYPFEREKSRLLPLSSD